MEYGNYRNTNNTNIYEERNILRKRIYTKTDQPQPTKFEIFI